MKSNVMYVHIGAKFTSVPISILGKWLFFHNFATSISFASEFVAVFHRPLAAMKS